MVHAHEARVSRIGAVEETAAAEEGAAKPIGGPDRIGDEWVLHGLRDLAVRVQHGLVGVRQHDVRVAIECVDARLQEICP